MTDHYTRDCLCCEGLGCSECDGTGKRITTYLGGGRFEMRVHGSAPLSDADKAALRQIGELDKRTKPDADAR